MWESNFCAYGADKVWDQLNTDGIAVARCTVERLMRHLGLQGTRRGRTFVRTTIGDDTLARPADLVQRRFRAPAPDRLWLADLTYVKTHSGWVFMAGGFSPDLTHHAMHALGYRIWGFSPEAFEDPDAFPIPDDPQEQEAMLRQVSQVYPNIVAIAMDASGGDITAVGSSCDEQYEFEFALDLLLDAFEQLHAAGWTSSER